FRDGGEPIGCSVLESAIFAIWLVAEDPELVFAEAFIHHYRILRQSELLGHHGGGLHATLERRAVYLGDIFVGQFPGGYQRLLLSFVGQRILPSRIGREYAGHVMFGFAMAESEVLVSALFSVGSELIKRTEHLVFFGGRIPPDRKRRAPVPLAADRPVTSAFKPASEAVLADVFRDPLHLAVLSHQLVLDIGDAHEPGGGGVV